MLLSVLLSLVACGNPCQQICTEMAAYAEECGLTVTDDDVKACFDAQKGPLEKEEAALCREESADDIREWWTCDDVAENFTNSAGTR